MAGQVASGSRLGTLPALEVEGLHLLQEFHLEAETPRGQLVEVATVLGLLLREHAALARADPRSRRFGALGQRRLRLFAERAKAHVRHEEGDLQPQRLGGTRADHELGFYLFVVEKWHAVELGRHDLDVVPARELRARHAHGVHAPVMARPLEPVLGHLLDPLL